MPVLNPTAQFIHSLKPPCSGVVEHWKASTLGGVCESSLEKVSWSYRYRSREGGNNERIILGSLGALWLADARDTALAPGSDGGGGTRRDARAPEMRDAHRGALLLVPPEMPDPPQEPAHILPDPRVRPEGRGSAEESVDRDHGNFAETPPGSLGFDGDLESEGPADGPAFKSQLIESFAPKHLDAGREIGQRGTGQAPEEEIRRGRKDAPKEAAAKPPAGMRVAGAADEV